MGQQQAMFEYDVGCEGILVDFYMYCRQICYEKLESNREMLGGPGFIIEVDEAKFGRRKFIKGKRVDGIWIFGMTERESGNCCFIPVETRDEETLIGEIKKFIRSGTIIYSDCWKAYSSLSMHGYQHFTVNHSKHFKDPMSGVHTDQLHFSPHTPCNVLLKHNL
jgi:hypothetical protein